ncbi:E3 ubiquitin/ISG15 ligase TRIM25-like [Brachyhypopomus gauderio]|uniref:E3 ubiquitin/ISG15 ligase TRIM25-like n=1 Tax=Brachyhypopomus gauderio TaxID=698409 RepID=UPI004042AC18
MAEAILTTQDLFNCPICLDLLKDPVAIPCGHSFCLGCINDCWDQDDQKGSYSCPQCRHSFTPRPVLNKNTMLAELTDKLRKTKLQDVAPVVSSVIPGDVECDVCSERKCQAVKSCLACLLSFCEAHVQNHYETPAYKRHKLIEASMNLQEKICGLHDRLLEVFCRKDQKLMCLLCMDMHICHEMASAEVERNVKQGCLVNLQRQTVERIQPGEEKLKKLREAMKFLQCSAQAALEESDNLFTELIQSIEQRCSDVKEMIRAQEKAELNHIEELVRNVEQEITDLRRRDAELEKLSLSDDHIHFLQMFPSVSALPVVTDISRIDTQPKFSLEFVKKICSEMNRRMNDDLTKLEMVKISEVRSILPWEPKTREELLKYSCRLTFNPDTLGNLQISERNKTASIPIPCFSWSGAEVVCSEGLSGRCYWEFERSGYVSVMLSYDNDYRKNLWDEVGLRSISVSTFSFDEWDSQLKPPTSSKIGVYLDHNAGILAFYRVSNNMELIQRIYTTFTHPLYPRFRLKLITSLVRLCDL